MTQTRCFAAIPKQHCRLLNYLRRRSVTLRVIGGLGLCSRGFNRQTGNGEINNGYIT
jgi:hypothetical protein